MFNGKLTYSLLIFCLLMTSVRAEDGSVIVPEGDDAALMQDLEDLKSELPAEEVTKIAPAAPVTEKDVEKLEFLDAKDADAFSDSNEINALKDPENEKLSSEQELQDDLESLKSDVGDLITVDPELDLEPTKKEEEPKAQQKVADKKEAEKNEGKEEIAIFDTGKEEKELLDVAQYIQGKIPSAEWDKIASQNKSEKYVVQEGDWLWKISKSLFGSGF